ncbi:TnsA endonuclease N-terminal domain-containing protein [Caulobacter flavus]|nr:TnsA endonuclease N-terminal domain-containing protein [Caulobacter flavus]
MTRIIPPSHRSITGSLPTRFPVRQLHYESKLERDFLILLEIEPGLETIATQPVTLDLVIEGRRRRYTPDVMATWWEDALLPYGRAQVVFEVKPYSILKRDYADLAPKYHAARQHLAAQGIGFRVVTDRTIYCTRQANAVLLGPAMRRPLSSDIMTTVRAIMTYPGVPHRTFGEVKKLLMADGLLRDTAHQALLHLLGIGYLVADLSLVISDTTQMRWWTHLVAEEALVEDS